MNFQAPCSGSTRFPLLGQRLGFLATLRYMWVTFLIGSVSSFHQIQHLKFSFTDNTMDEEPLRDCATALFC